MVVFPLTLILIVELLLLLVFVFTAAELEISFRGLLVYYLLFSKPSSEFLVTLELDGSFVISPVN